MQLTTKTKGVEKLERLETEINTEAFEAFYHIGQKLLEIKREELYREGRTAENRWLKRCKWGGSGRFHARKQRATAPDSLL